MTCEFISVGIVTYRFGLEISAKKIPRLLKVSVGTIDLRKLFQCQCFSRINIKKRQVKNIN